MASAYWKEVFKEITIKEIQFEKKENLFIFLKNYKISKL
jgi:hypothetical protein